MKNKIIKQFFSMLIAALILIPPALKVFAQMPINDEVPYYSYSYWQDGFENTLVRNKAMFKVKDVLTAEKLGIENFMQLSDMCLGPDGYIYTVDSVAADVTVISNELKVINRIKVFKYNGEELTLTKPRGVFVSDKNELYVCDTEGERILICDIYGNVDRILAAPDSSLMPEDFLYRPLKIAVDNKGYTYVLSDGSYYGAVFYNPNGEFVGFYGANSVENSILTVLKNFWNKLTMTDEKRAGSVKSLPYQFTDLYIDNSGFVYTATGTINSGSQKDTIRRLSPGGVNILKTSGENFGEGSTTVKSDGSVIKQDISGLCVDDSNFIYAYDRALGNIYVYDNNSNFINAFGGGVGMGTQAGVFKLPCAIDVFEEDLYVCDGSNQTITIFELTEYGRLVKTAQKYTLDGDYDGASELWKEVIALDKNCRYAYIGLGKAALVNKDYKAAAEYAKKGLDRDIYAQAYEQLRGDWMNRNFSLIFVAVVLLSLAVVVGLVYKKKKNIIWLKNRRVQLAATTVLHPASSFAEIQEKNNGSVLLACLIIFLFYISEIVKNECYGFAFSSNDVSAFNSVVVLVRSLGAVLIWTVTNWAVSTLFGGLGKLKEIFIVTSYTLNILIIANIATTILSNFLLPEESAFLSLIMTVAWIYTAIVLTIGLIRIHDYSFGKFIITTLLSIFGLLLIVFLIAATVILVQQFYMFFATLFYEITFR